MKLIQWITRISKAFYIRLVRQCIYAKPIFIVSIPSKNANEYVAELTEILNKRLNDYHVLVVQYDEIDFPEFKVFYEKDFNKVKYEELKAIVSKYVC